MISVDTNLKFNSFIDLYSFFTCVIELISPLHITDIKNFIYLRSLIFYTDTIK